MKPHILTSSDETRARLLFQALKDAFRIPIELEREGETWFIVGADAALDKETANRMATYARGFLAGAQHGSLEPRRELDVTNYLDDVRPRS